MSIFIDKSKCVGCKSCVEVCPGNLIKILEEKAEISRPQDCWGCTSCLKACKLDAVKFYLGADIGGKGSTLSVSENRELREWVVTTPDGNQKKIVINTKESNKY